MLMQESDVSLWPTTISKDLSVTERKMTVEYHHEIESGETTMYQVEKISVES